MLLQNLEICHWNFVFDLRLVTLPTDGQTPEVVFDRSDQIGNHADVEIISGGQ